MSQTFVFVPVEIPYIPTVLPTEWAMNDSLPACFDNPFEVPLRFQEPVLADVDLPEPVIERGERGSILGALFPRGGPITVLAGRSNQRGDQLELQPVVPEQRRVLFEPKDGLAFRKL